MQCSQGNCLTMAQWMVDNGADPNQQMNLTGWTAMHSAAKVGSLEILKLLLDHGGTPNLKAKHRDIGINLTVSDCTTNQEILDLLSQYTN